MDEQTRSVYDFLDYRAFLKSYIEEKRAENPGFSIRSIAYRMECDPGFFNRILNGKRNLSQAHALRLSDILKLTKREQRYFAQLVQFCQAGTQAEKDRLFAELETMRDMKVARVTTRQYEIYSHWYYIVLRELLNVIPADGAGIDYQRLAGYLEPSVKPTDIKNALRVLERSGVLERNETGGIRLTDKFISSGENIPQVVVDRILTEFTDRAREAIDRFPRNERQLSTLTFSVSHKGYEKIKRRLAEYRREILTIVDNETDKAERVYHMNFHLFPVTKPIGDAEE